MNQLDTNPDKADAADLYARFLAKKAKRIGSPSLHVTMEKDWQDEERDEQGRWTSGGGDGGPAYPSGMNLNPSVVGIVGDSAEHLALRDRATAAADSMGTKFKLGGIDPAAQAGIVDSIEHFREQYPEVKFSVGAHSMASMPQFADAYAVTMAPGSFNLEHSEITLNTDRLNNPAELARGWNFCTLSGFHPSGTGVPELRTPNFSVESTRAAAQAVMDHELGHVLGNFIGVDAEKTALYGAADKIAMTVPEAAQSISVYATESEREAVAEAAMDVRGVSPSAASQAIMEAMNQAYRDKVAA
jgi:hypothetical protein